MTFLRLVQSAEEEQRSEQAFESVSFCGHCGEQPHDADADSRVCVSCGLGLVLSASAELAPKLHEPFLIIDSSLSVCALSASAEELLDVDETQAVNRHVAEFLVPADANAPTSHNLLSLIADAGRVGPPRRAVVRPLDEFGVRYKVRIGACGPPDAALVVVDG